jgi:hypothetical protein
LLTDKTNTILSTGYTFVQTQEKDEETHGQNWGLHEANEQISNLSA